MDKQLYMRGKETVTGWMSPNNASFFNDNQRKIKVESEKSKMSLF